MRTAPGGGLKGLRGPRAARPVPLDESIGAARAAVEASSRLYRAPLALTTPVTVSGRGSTTCKVLILFLVVPLVRLCSNLLFFFFFFFFFEGVQASLLVLDSSMGRSQRLAGLTRPSVCLIPSSFPLIAIAKLSEHAISTTAPGHSRGAAEARTKEGAPRLGNSYLSRPFG
ncbi:hypothetical protein SEVIR_8G233250v4 [Setaria viridis]|uniref:Uncharacterized protein n=1 Tax=Setaria viridis TaxID=4556 RepID=A0A4U6TKH1_SETVI|nr:hypothetical protein SEVIR_8G233250v2 [Setaria viridis]